MTMNHAAARLALADMKQFIDDLDRQGIKNMPTLELRSANGLVQADFYIFAYDHTAEEAREEAAYIVEHVGGEWELKHISDAYWHAETSLPNGILVRITMDHSLVGDLVLA